MAKVELKTLARLNVNLRYTLPGSDEDEESGVLRGSVDLQAYEPVCKALKVVGEIMSEEDGAVTKLTALNLNETMGAIQDGIEVALGLLLSGEEEGEETGEEEESMEEAVPGERMEQAETAQVVEEEENTVELNEDATEEGTEETEGGDSVEIDGEE